jgi:hypothetical protein
MVRGSSPGVARFSAPVQTGPAAHPASCAMGTGSFPEVKSGRGVMLTPYPLLVPWSRKGRAIPLLPLWAIRPVQSLSGCTRGALYLFTEIKYREGRWKRRGGGPSTGHPSVDTVSEGITTATGVNRLANDS